MSFCKFSTEYIAQNSTSVDNLFINAFLPYAPDVCVKVYLYGLSKCYCADSFDNTLERFSKVLNLSEEDIEQVFLYWQELGLVQIIATEPFEVKYIPVKSAISKSRKFSEDKYADFNAQVENMIKGRMPSPNEFFEYYNVIETMHIEIPAMLSIIKYCTMVKGESVGYPYIITVAKNWAYDGVRTSEDVEERLKQLEQNSSLLGDLMKIMGIKRIASLEEKEMLKKWQEQDFDEHIIQFTAKLIKKHKKRCNFGLLNDRLSKYFELKLFTEQEIEAYENNKESLLLTAKTITKSLGLYYENLEPVVDNYITKWDALGYDQKTLCVIANYCFKNSVRTLELMDSQIQKLFKLGIVSEDSFNEYMEEIIEENTTIKYLLEKIGLVRSVNAYDREMFATWTKDWLMPVELIEYVSTLCFGKYQPMQYANKILAYLHSKNISTVDDAKNANLSFIQSTQAQDKKITHNHKNREYSKQDLSAMYTKIEEVEI